MAWINVVDNRRNDLAMVLHRTSLKRAIRKDTCDLAFRFLRLGQPERVIALEPKIHEGADGVLQDLKGPGELGKYVISETTVGLLILSSLLGKDRKADLKKLLKLESLADAAGKARVAVLRRLFDPHERKAGEKPLSSFASDRDKMYRRIDALPTPEALDLSNSPGGPSYPWTDGLILPLSYVLAVERESDISANTVSTLIASGAYPERRGQLLSDCSLEPGELDEKDRANAESQHAFTAVEEKDDQLIAYWWIGFVKGKLVFNEINGPNEFRMFAPDHLAQAWKLVQKQVGENKWDEIRGRVKANQVKYIMVVDITLVEVAETEVRRAAEAYDIDLTVQHLFDV